MTHEIRRNIILTLIHRPQAQFNELSNVQSNKLSYHLNKLIDEGIIQRTDKGYELTSEGRTLATNIEGDTGASVRYPTQIVMIAARDENGRILAQQRLKEPYYGYWGLPAGKLNFGWNPEERAKRDLYEETGLTAGNIRFCAIEYIKTYEEDTLLHHHIMHVYEATNCTGELIKETHKAKNKWMSVEEYRLQQRFPGDWIFKWLSQKDFFVVEGELYMKEKAFVGAKTVSIQQLTQH